MLLNKHYPNNPEYHLYNINFAPKLQTFTPSIHPLTLWFSMASGKRDSNPRPSAWEIYQWCVRVYLSVVCGSGCFYGKQFTNIFIDIYRYLSTFIAIYRHLSLFNGYLMLFNGYLMLFNGYLMLFNGYLMLFFLSNTLTGVLSDTNGLSSSGWM